VAESRCDYGKRLLLEWCIVDHAVSGSDAEELTKNALNDEGVFLWEKDQLI
jgi:hypothetical protein